MSAPLSDRPSVLVTDALIDSFVSQAGYTHPLFRPVQGGVGFRPLPGQAVLLLMGGLAEQSGVLDHAIALVEIMSARFHRMVTAGMILTLEIDPGTKTTTSSGKVIQVFHWTATIDDDEVVVSSDVKMLMKQDTQEGQ